jgi:G3E family GTPase
MATPITVVAGFLGAGKTTFVRRVLGLFGEEEQAGEKSGNAQHVKKRVAVLQNEAGAATGADEAQVAQRGNASHFEWVELVNGCACCTVKDDMLQAVEELAKRGVSGSSSSSSGSSSESQPFDHIIIECSGLADPGALAAGLWVDPSLESEVYLDAVITFIDCKHIERHLDAPAGRPRVAPVASVGDDAERQQGHEGGVVGSGADGNEGNGTDDEPVSVPHATEAYRQIAFADRVVLNKTDLVGVADVGRLRERVRGINSTAPILESVRSNVPLENVLGIRAFGARDDPSSDAHIVGALGVQHEGDGSCGCHKAASDEPCAHLDTTGPRDSPWAQHSHDSRVSTASVVHRGSVNLSQFEDWLGSLVWDDELSRDEFDRDSERDMVLYRYKGVIAVAGEDFKYVLQGVHGIFEIEPTEHAWGPAEERACTLVFIGVDVDSRSLAASLRATLGSS